jgi:hypothetical protein
MTNKMFRQQALMNGNAIIQIPRNLRQFGYNTDKSEGLRRTALIRANEIVGKESVLFNLSSLIVLNDKNKHSEIFKNDLNFFIKNLKGGSALGMGDKQ